MNENLFNVKITVLNSTTQYTIQPRLCISKYPVLEKMISFWSRLIACCKLAPTLVRQMWRHNYVIDRNEYLIFTLLESINPWVYSLQLLFKSTDNSWRYERKCEWVFFFWTQCTICKQLNLYHALQPVLHSAYTSFRHTQKFAHDKIS